MSRRIWTCTDYSAAVRAACDQSDIRALTEHGIYADHCEGYEVLAWPCAVVVPILNRLLGGAK